VLARHRVLSRGQQPGQQSQAKNEEPAGADEQVGCVDEDIARGQSGDLGWVVQRVEWVDGRLGVPHRFVEGPDAVVERLDGRSVGQRAQSEWRDRDGEPRGAGQAEYAVLAIDQSPADQSQRDDRAGVARQSCRSGDHACGEPRPCAAAAESDEDGRQGERERQRIGQGDYSCSEQVGRERGRAACHQALSQPEQSDAEEKDQGG